MSSVRIGYPYRVCAISYTQPDCLLEGKLRFGTLRNLETLCELSFWNSHLKLFTHLLLTLCLLHFHPVVISQRPGCPCLQHWLIILFFSCCPALGGSRRRVVVVIWESESGWLLFPMFRWSIFLIHDNSYTLQGDKKGKGTKSQHKCSDNSPTPPCPSLEKTSFEHT